MLRQRRPAGAEIIAGGGLAAAMQHDDQRARLGCSCAGTNANMRRFRDWSRSRDLVQRAVA